MDIKHPVINQLLSLSCDPLVICDQQLLIVQANTEFENYFAWSFSQLQGKSVSEIFITNDSDFLRFLEKPDKHNEEWRGQLEVKFCEKGSIIRPVRLQRIDLDNSCYFAFVFCHGKAEDSGSELQLDELTQLPKQDLFMDRLDQAMIAAPRVNKSVAVMIIGIDQLDRIRDGLGYETGNQILQTVARRLSETIRRSDTAARLSDDRFALAMQITSVEDSVIVAEKIIAAVARETIVNNQAVAITASIGISIFPADSPVKEKLLIHAESAMRHIKEKRGQDYEFYSQNLNDMAKSRIEMENSLRRGLTNEEFVVFYQPKVNLDTNAIVGAEALVRWIVPGEGMVSPAEFIPVAEETSLIGDIGDYVMARACQQNSDWLAKGLGPLRISVNVAAAQFHDHHLIDKVQKILDETGLPHHQLELEITESTLVGEMDKVIEKLRVFRDMGLHVSIDDFGTGYSSLSYLSHFPITTLKIDRAFVKDMEKDSRTAEITSAIIGLSQGLSLEVVAEGAESLEHVQLLRQKGCDQVQGFFFSRPLPAEEFEKILREGYLYDE